jgi:hypothetical protein
LVGELILWGEWCRLRQEATLPVLQLHAPRIAQLIQTFFKCMIWILIMLISAIFIYFGVWSFHEKERLRNLQLGDRAILTIEQVIQLFNESGNYEESWLSVMLDELAKSTSTKVGLMRPTDRLGNELMPIKGFEGFDRFDWLPDAIYNQLRNDLTAADLIKLLWDYHQM